MKQPTALHTCDLPQTPASQPKIIRIREVQARTGLARPTLYKLIQQSRFPAGVDLLGTGRAVGWEEQAVSDWISERISAAKKPASDLQKQ